MLIALICITLACVISALMSIALININNLYPGSKQGILEWTLSAACLFLMIVFIFLRTNVHAFISIAIPNTLGMLAVLFYYLGTRLHIKAKTQHQWSFVIAFGFTMLGLHTFFTVVMPNVHARYLINSVTALTIATLHLYIVMTYLQKGIGKSCFIFSIGLELCFWMYRLLDLLILGESPQFFGSMKIDIFNVIAISILIILVPLSCLLLLSQHLRSIGDKKANHDQLTDALLNIDVINAFKLEINRSQRQKYSLSFIFFHVVGLDRNHLSPIDLKEEMIMTQFIQETKQVLRDTDIVGKINRNNFVLMLPDTNEAGAIVVAHRITERCAQNKSLLTGAHISIVSLSETKSTVEKILKSGLTLLEYAQSNRIVEPLVELPPGANSNKEEDLR